MNPSTPETRLRATLRAYADRAMAGRDVWPDVARELQMEPARSRSIRVMPTLAPALTVGSLLALLLLVGGLGLLSPHKADSLQATAGTLTVATATVWAPGPLMQARDGYTITIQPVSADFNRVVISYTMTAPGQAARILYQSLGGSDRYTPGLRTSSGIVLPWYGGAQTDRGRFNPAASTSVTSSAFMTFDTQAADLSGPLQLDLMMPVGHVGSVFTSSQRIAPNSPITEAVTIVDIPDLGTPAAAQTPIAPFLFHFTMPLDTHRRVAAVQQTIEHQGVRLTLDRVVVTASETRIILHWAVPNEPGIQVTMPGMPRLHIDSDIVPHGGSDGLGSGRLNQNGDGGTWTYSYFDSLLTKSNDWAFYVQDVSKHDPQADSAANDTPVPGQWAFHFTVPPLTTP